MAPRNGEVTQAILDTLANGPVSREQLIDRAGQVFPPGKAFRLYERDLEWGRTKGDASRPGRRPYSGTMNSHRNIHTHDDKIMFGRRREVLSKVASLRQKGKVEMYRENGVDFYRLTTYTHPESVLLEGEALDFEIVSDEARDAPARDD
jgi:hypothetical protein